MAITATTDALRHSLELIEPHLKDFQSPGGAFDPTGAWTQTYRIVPLTLDLKVFGGQLKMRRTPRADGAQIEVEQELRLMKGKDRAQTVGYSQWTKASLLCGTNLWSTPQRLTAESWTVSPDGQAQAETREKFSAEISGTEIRFSGVRKPTVRVARDWTLDWTLFDALQRLLTDQPTSWQLDIVEDCDLVRPRQRLSYAGPLTAKVAGKEMQLFGFLHYGIGTLPTHYWLDAQHRLLFVNHYFRVFILTSSISDPKPEK